MRGLTGIKLLQFVAAEAQLSLCSRRHVLRVCFVWTCRGRGGFGIRHAQSHRSLLLEPGQPCSQAAMLLPQCDFRAMHNKTSTQIMPSHCMHLPRFGMLRLHASAPRSAVCVELYGVVDIG